MTLLTNVMSRKFSVITEKLLSDKSRVRSHRLIKYSPATSVTAVLRHLLHRGSESSNILAGKRVLNKRINFRSTTSMNHLHRIAYIVTNNMDKGMVGRLSLVAIKLTCSLGGNGRGELGR